MDETIKMLFHEFKGDIQDSRRFWIYVCMKQWYFYWLGRHPSVYADVDSVALRVQVSALAIRLEQVIDEHTEKPVENIDDLYAEFRRVDKLIWQTIREMPPCL